MFKLYEVDPEADTLLIVPHPSRPFAPWDEPSEASTSASLSSPSDVYAGILRGTSRPPNIYASIASAPELRLKVSSQHLILASKHFRNRFRYSHHRPQSDNDDSNSSDGRIHITLSPGYDPKAIITVMDIVHGRGRKVPRTLDGVETLAQIAVVVDAFKFHDTAEVYAERWFADLLKDGRPEKRLNEATDDRELVLWIYASYVFRQAKVFKAATRIAVLRSDGPLRNLGLQVRDGVIREIESRRQQAISAALDVVEAALDGLQQDESPCSLGCDTFLLGALVKSLRRGRLAFPRPARPYLGVSVLEVSRAVSQAQDVLARQFASSFGPSWGLLPMAATRKRKTPNAQPSGTALLTPESSPEPERSSGGFREHTCEARENDLFARLEELERGVGGLDLESKLGYYLY